MVLPSALCVRMALSNHWANCRRAGDPALISWHFANSARTAYISREMTLQVRVDPCVLQLVSRKAVKRDFPVRGARVPPGGRMDPRGGSTASEAVNGAQNQSLRK